MDNSIFALLAYSNNMEAINSIAENAIEDYMLYNRSGKAYNGHFSDKDKFTYLADLISNDAKRIINTSTDTADRLIYNKINAVFNCLNAIVANYLYPYDGDDDNLIYTLKITILKSLCIISKGMSTYPQYTDSFGPLGNIMNEYSHKAYNPNTIDSIIKDVFNSNSISLVTSYNKVFEARFGYHICQAIYIIVNELDTSKISTYDINILNLIDTLKFSIYIMVNNVLKHIS